MIGIGIGINRLRGGAFDQTGLSLTPDYWIDAASGDDGNAGTSEGAAWASLNKIESIAGTVGADTVIRVKSGTYDKISDHFEVNGFDGQMVIVFEAGCVMDGTANGATAQNPIYAGNAPTVMTIYGNGLTVQNFFGLSGGTPNGIGWGGAGTTVTARDVTLSNCSDGISGHESGHGVFYDCTVLGNHNKFTIANVGNSSMAAYRCVFYANDAASGGFVVGEGTGLHTFENCKFVPGTTEAARKISCEYQVFNKCHIGTATSAAQVEGRVSFSPSVSILIKDSFINLDQQASPRVTMSGCYGKLSVRNRSFASGTFTLSKSIISGPATGEANIFYSNFNPGAGGQHVISDNIFETASAAAFMSYDATNSAYLVAAGSEFFNNILSGSAAYDADLIAAGGGVIAGTVTADALIGAANTLDPDDYGYGAGSPAIGAATDGGNCGFAVGELSGVGP
jgi:hypothetical protein